MINANHNESAVTPIAKTITIHETGNGKMPGCYKGKTFELTQVFLLEERDGEGPRTFIWYESTLKNGKKVRFTYFINFRETAQAWNISRKGYFASTWASNVTVTY